MIDKGYMFTKGACMYAVTGSAVSGTTGEVLYLCQELREGGKLIAWNESAIRGTQMTGAEAVNGSTVQMSSEQNSVDKSVVKQPKKEVVHTSFFSKTKQKEQNEEPVLSDSEMSDLEAFLETDSCVRKLEILQHMRSKATISMLDAMSISLDLENENGSLEEKYYCLERYLKMRIRYEGRR